MDRESMARLGFAFFLVDHGAPREVAGLIAFSRDPDVYTGYVQAVNDGLEAGSE